MATKPKPRPSRATDWHLICITRKGKVSMLKNLDLRSARETYKRLMPHTKPVEYIENDCGGTVEWSGRSHIIFGGTSFTISGEPSEPEDQLSRVDIVGPEGVELDPWHGVPPIIRDRRADHAREVRRGDYHCSVCSEKPTPAQRQAKALAQTIYTISEPTPTAEVVVLDTSDESPEDRRIRELYEQVPTAFWLEPANA